MTEKAGDCSRVEGEGSSTKYHRESSWKMQAQKCPVDLATQSSAVTFANCQWSGRLFKTLKASQRPPDKAASAPSLPLTTFRCWPPGFSHAQLLVGRDTGHMLSHRYAVPSACKPFLLSNSPLSLPTSSSIISARKPSETTGLRWVGLFSFLLPITRLLGRGRHSSSSSLSSRAGPGLSTQFLSKLESKPWRWKWGEASSFLLTR